MTPAERAMWALDLIPSMESTQRNQAAALIQQSLREAYADGWSARGRADISAVEDRLSMSPQEHLVQDAMKALKAAIDEAGKRVST
jgi:hypothetical protein